MNNDNELNVLDIIIIINHIIGSVELSPIQQNVGDINGDGYINVQDIVILVSIIIAGN